MFVCLCVREILILFVLYEVSRSYLKCEFAKFLIQLNKNGLPTIILTFPNPPIDIFRGVISIFLTIPYNKVKGGLPVCLSVCSVGSR